MIDCPAPPSSPRLRLLERIHRRYQTVTQSVRVGDLPLEFTRVADPDVVLDAVCAQEDLRQRRGESGDEAKVPYWAQLWESAAGLAEAIAKIPLKNGDRVLDLGCGMGLAGMAAAALGASVVLGDWEASALLFARLNTLAYADRVRVRRMDWSKDRLGERFDFILGADILYERGQWEALEKFWRIHLTENGVVLLGEPGRQTGEGFVAWIGERGWKLCETAEISGTKSVRVFKLQKS